MITNQEAINRETNVSRPGAQDDKSVRPRRHRRRAPPKPSSAPIPPPPTAEAGPGKKRLTRPCAPTSVAIRRRTGTSPPAS